MFLEKKDIVSQHGSMHVAWANLGGGARSACPLFGFPQVHSRKGQVQYTIWREQGHASRTPLATFCVLSALQGSSNLGSATATANFVSWLGHARVLSRGSSRIACQGMTLEVVTLRKQRSHQPVKACRHTLEVIRTDYRKKPEESTDISSRRGDSQ